MTPHQKKLIKECTRDAKNRWGKAWHQISDSQQMDSISREVLRTILCLDEATPITHAQEIARAALYPDLN
jgi:hypothetical protein